MKLLVIGFTHLGLVYSSCFAGKGVEVTLSASDLRVKPDYDYSNLRAEPHLMEVIEDLLDAGMLSFAQFDCLDFSVYDLIFVSEDTQLDENGIPVYEKISKILEHIDSFNHRKRPVVLMSQVFPGFCAKNRITSPLIYWVETLVFGRAIDRANNPEQFVLGFDEIDSVMPDALLKLLGLFATPIHKMSWESAELTKISFNFMLSMSIVGANFLASIAEQVGANWNDVKGALRFDSRIGKQAYLNPGLGITGGNLPRDLKTLEFLVDSMSDLNKSFLSEVVFFSENQYLWVSECINDLQQEYSLKDSGGYIGILGLTYKEGTSSTTNSPAVKLVKSCPDTTFLAFDPMINELGNINNLKILQSSLEVIKNSRILVLTTPWKEILEALKTSDCDFENKYVIDSGAWLDKETLRRFRAFRQRGTGNHEE